MYVCIYEYIIHHTHTYTHVFTHIRAHGHKRIIFSYFFYRRVRTNKKTAKVSEILKGIIYLLVKEFHGTRTENVKNFMVETNVTGEKQKAIKPPNTLSYLSLRSRFVTEKVTILLRSERTFRCIRDFIGNYVHKSE